jgi:3-oxoadipate enol-lactonase
MILQPRFVRAEHWNNRPQERGPMTDTTDREMPAGRYVDLPRRGRIFVREGGIVGAPVVLLLHGWTANADLNWRAAYPALTERFHVIAPDHRGHGRGIRDTVPFRLEACADDAAALLRALDIDDAVVAGYSMGGPIAQLLWKRNRDLVDGLVLCATSRTFNGTPREHAMFSLLAGASVAARRMSVERRNELAMRVARRQLDHDWLAIIEAGRAIGRFDSRPWIRSVDVPTAVVVTTRDRVVPAARQRELAASIRGASVHEVAGDHAVCLAQADLFVPALLDGIESVLSRHRAVAAPRALALAA